MHVNNEIGSIQPVKDIGRLIKGKGMTPVFHVDAIQSFGKIDLKPESWGIDILSVSGHKIHAPKGVGALYIRKGIKRASCPLGRWTGKEGYGAERRTYRE